jgi:cytochrome c oxidase cbb3-type subunit IV
MYKNVMTGIPGIEFYPIVALLLFFGFFAGVVAWFFLADRRKLDVIARQPLEDDVFATITGEPHTIRTTA